MTTGDFVLVPRRLLERCGHELTNLMTKVAHKEDAGWEGVQRRTLLMSDLDKAMLSASPQHIGSPLRGADVRVLREAVLAATTISRTYGTEYAGRSYIHCTACDACLSESKPHEDDCAWLKIDAAALSPAPGGSSIPMGVTEEMVNVALTAYHEGPTPRLDYAHGEAAHMRHALETALALPTGQPK